ncbi:hypothetical protein BraRD5C2_68080 [Bradyrhizobium sp. RD5-C2]|nr:hypothetical protein BraRD5C2_68080 [Bradyrhizobium sp. RD5-C2]
MAVAMTAPDSDDGIGAAESTWRCDGQRGCTSDRCKAAECSKSNKCKFELHWFPPMPFKKRTPEESSFSPANQSVAHSRKLNVNEG